jgi:hypothetical protein
VVDPADGACDQVARQGVGVRWNPQDKVVALLHDVDLAIIEGDVDHDLRIATSELDERGR